CGHCFINIGSGKFLMFGGLSSDGYFNDTYIYDLGVNSWTKKNFSVEPSSRAYFSVCYSSETKRVYLFGGTNGSEYFNDLWYYDVENSSWNYVLVDSSPSARKGHKMAYNPKLKKIVMFGGWAPTSVLLSDLWVFDTQSNKWEKIDPLPGGDTPTARSDFIFEYLPEIDRFILFGGYPLNSETWLYNQNTNEWSTAGDEQNKPSARYQSTGFVYNNSELYIFGGNTGTAVSDLWKYTVKSSGTFILQISTTSPTSVVWKQFWLNAAVIPSSTSVKFQIASSQDGFNWDEYRGYNGSTTTFYEGSGPHDIWSGHSGKLNIRIKGYLDTEIPPKSPEVPEICVSFNITPPAPQLNLPKDNSDGYSGRINQLQPLFNWNKSIDTEEDPVTYRIQISTNQDFSSVYVNYGGIIETSSPTVNFNLAELLPGTSLYEGNWYWHVCAEDVSQGPWSNHYTFYVDTTPPSNVTSITALKAQGNGKIDLNWISPGDNGMEEKILWGKYYIGYTTSGPINSENDWQNAKIKTFGNLTFANPGSEMKSSVDGLLDGTTYWFAIKVQDTAGNISSLSSVSPCAKTNSRPEVQITTPTSGTFSKEIEVSWTHFDVDPDTHTFDIKLSSDSGISYSINVATALPESTTFYIWNSRQVKNGSYYLKVICYDNFNLSGEATSYITIDNVNEPPFVTIISPSSGTLSGKVSINWLLTDPNGEDTHNIKIYYSDDDGLNFYLLSELTNQTTFYIWDTTKNKNGPGYRLKIYVEENNTQEKLSAEYITNKLSIDNRNFPPNSFKLVSPPSGAVLPVIKIELKWENNGDPNPEDSLLWTVFISTDEYFRSYTTIENLSQNFYILTPKDGLIEEKKYYWKVLAIDPLGKQSWSENIFDFYVLNRKKAYSVDGNVYSEVLSGMPEGGFIYIEKINPENYSVFNIAQKYAIGDRSIKILSQDFYKVEIVDINQNRIQSDNIEVKISFKYPEKSGVPVERLRIAKLDEKLCRWVFPPNKQEQNKYNKSIEVVVKGLSIFTLAGSNVSDRLLSNINIFPNPFSAGKENVYIRYTLNENAKIVFKVYTLIGDLVKKWEYDSGIEGKSKGQPEGYTNEIIWNGKNENGQIVANGMYLLVMEAESENSSAREMKYIGVIKR
ncbi:MAG: kelch repeat-containing protein, partial [Endomicrobiia bacterium]